MGHSSPVVPMNELIVCGDNKDVTVIFQEFEEFVGL
jgi:hypothetical protein